MIEINEIEYETNREFDNFYRLNVCVSILYLHGEYNRFYVD